MPTGKAAFPVAARRRMCYTVYRKLLTLKEDLTMETARSRFLRYVTYYLSLIHI